MDYSPSKDIGFRFTERDKVKVLGENFARLHDIDIPATRKAIANDRFSAWVRQNGLREPFVEQRKLLADAGLTDKIQPFDGPRDY
jgi:hypothetical protein